MLITAADVLIALGASELPAQSRTAKTQALEQSGVLALAQVVGIHETGTRINEQPLVKLDLQISGPGITPFATQDRVHRVHHTAAHDQATANWSRSSTPGTNHYQIDWERSALVGGLMPANFTIAEDNKTYDLSGQAGPLMEILQILKANGIGLNNMIDLRSNPAARAARAGRGPARRGGAAGHRRLGGPAGTRCGRDAAPPEPTTAQRLQELETLRATGAISDDEYQRQASADPVRSLAGFGLIARPN